MLLLQYVVIASKKFQEKLFLRVPSQKTQAWMPKRATSSEWGGEYEFVKVKDLSKIPQGLSVVTAVEPNFMLSIQDRRLHDSHNNRRDDSYGIAH